MIIKSTRGDEKTLLDALCLKPDSCPMIAAVGAGGKTSLLYALADELLASGRRVIVTTTTHIIPRGFAVTEPSPANVTAALEKDGCITVGFRAGDGGKLSGSPELPGLLRELCDVVLVEADGSKRRPIKAPSSHEPVIPTDCGLVVGVAGLSALGRPMGECCHRPELAAEILDCDLDTSVTEAHIAALLSSPQGQKKNITGAYRFMLGQWDENIKGGEKTLELAGKAGLDGFAVSFRLQES